MLSGTKHLWPAVGDSITQSFRGKQRGNATFRQQVELDCSSFASSESIPCLRIDMSSFTPTQSWTSISWSVEAATISLSACWYFWRSLVLFRLYILKVSWNLEKKTNKLSSISIHWYNLHLKKFGHITTCIQSFSPVHFLHSNILNIQSEKFFESAGVLAKFKQRNDVTFE